MTSSQVDLADGGVADSADVLGVAISAVQPASARDRVMAWIDSREKHYVCVVSVHGVVTSVDDPAFKDILNRAGLAVPDGMPLSWVMRLGGCSHVRRTTGPDLMLAVSETLGQRGGSAFYYGGAPGVAEELASEMERRYPGLRTAGLYCPPYRPLTPDEEADVAQRINASGADVVWVGLGCPKQEIWMRDFRGRLETPVILGVGAAFDVHTGRITRPPAWIQNLGLEWFYRLVQEPRRLWRRYATTNPRFVFYVLCEKLGLRDFGSNR